jgi:hypothetical protein
MKLRNIVVVLLAALNCAGAHAAQAELDRDRAQAVRSADQQAQQEAADARAELAEASEAMRKAARRVAQLSAATGDNVGASTVLFLGDQDRAVIGIVLDNPTTGPAVIRGLSPGGPAEQAGIQVGDEVIEINGRAVPNGARARHTLVDALAALQVDQSVQLRVLRDGRSLDVTVKAERPDPGPLLLGNWLGQLDKLGDLGNLGDLGQLSQLGRLEVLQNLGPEIERRVQASLRSAGVDEHMGERIRERVEKAMSGARMSWYSSSDDLDLADLNPGLARYFGTDQGVLVLDRKGEDYAALQAGDVLLSVAGESVASPRTALQKLGARKEGEQFEVTVLRDRQQLALMLTGTGNLLELRELLPPPPPPAPPAPAAPAAPRLTQAPLPPAPPPPPEPTQFEL